MSSLGPSNQHISLLSLPPVITRQIWLHFLASGERINVHVDENGFLRPSSAVLRVCRSMRRSVLYIARGRPEAVGYIFTTPWAFSMAVGFISAQPHRIPSVYISNTVHTVHLCPLAPIAVPNHWPAALENLPMPAKPVPQIPRFGGLDRFEPSNDSQRSKWAHLGWATKPTKENVDDTHTDRFEVSRLRALREIGPTTHDLWDDWARSLRRLQSLLRATPMLDLRQVYVHVSRHPSDCGTAYGGMMCALSGLLAENQGCSALDVKVVHGPTIHIDLHRQVVRALVRNGPIGAPIMLRVDGLLQSNYSRIRS